MHELYEERRRELVKQVKALAEEAKVAIRNIRRDALDTFKKMEKANEMTKDEIPLNQASDNLDKSLEYFYKAGVELYTSKLNDSKMMKITRIADTYW